MNHFLYIIFSASKNTSYIGETHNLEQCLMNHNEHRYTNGFSKIANDWEIVLSFPCESKDDALYLEKFIKRMKSKKFTSKIIESPKILNDILNNR